MRRPLAALLVVLAFAAAGATSSGARRADRVAPLLLGLNVTNGGAPYAGDAKLLTTITPNEDGLRDRALIHFRLREPATVQVAICRTATGPEAIYARGYRLPRGAHTLTWEPKPTRQPRTYLVRIRVRDRAGNKRIYGAARPHRGRDAPVVRVQGIDAAFDAASYVAGAQAGLRIATDAPRLVLQLYRSGPEFARTTGPGMMQGRPVSTPLDVDWFWPGRPRTIPIKVPQAPSGLYFAKLSADDGRVGYAPFVIRTARPGSTARVAVVLPTNTWQAYNFYDADGNGWGDTWYAGPPADPAVLRIGLQRPFLNRGVPPHFRQYDLGFLHWVPWTGKTVEYLADPDLARFRTGRRLARAYDWVIFSGHEEYVTSTAYRIVRQFRNRGGNLAFLSANNFYWRVAARGSTLRRVGKWRDLGSPEAAIIGIQYRGNDGGQTQRPYRVRRAGRAPWLFAGTRLRNGSRFGHFGIEVDAKARSSPRRTVVLAEIPRIFGGRVTAQMSYYETRRGAKVFAFGAFTLGGGATQPLLLALLENLWARLSRP